MSTINIFSALWRGVELLLINWIHPFPFILVLWFLRCWCYSCHLLLDHILFTFIHGPNIPGSYVILFFAGLDFTFINCISFLLWLSQFILSGAISNCPPSFLSSILDTFQTGDSSFSVISLCPFMQFMGFSWQVYWGGLPFPLPADHILSELSTIFIIFIKILPYQLYR